MGFEVDPPQRTTSPSLVHLADEPRTRVMVREGGLEPPSLSADDFESSASTNSATLAKP